MLNNKKAALTTRQIVILTILIISFIIILFLIFRLNLGGTTRKEVCHNSVVLKGKSLFPSAVSLDCHTEYICLSQTNKCDKIDNPDDLIIVKTEEDVYKTLADKMADCWWMFGEGSIDYVGGEALSYLHCSICSQIYFDESIKQIFNSETFSQKEVYDYIVKHEIPGKKIEYDEYLYEGSDFKTSDEILETIKEDLEREGEVGFTRIDLNKSHLILMGIHSEVSTLTWLIGGAVLGALTVIALPIVGGGFLAAGATVLIIGGASGAALGAAAAEGIDYYYSGISMEGKSGLEYLRPIIIEKDSESFNKHGCEYIDTLS